jgi:hypothetical protein
MAAHRRPVAVVREHVVHPGRREGWSSHQARSIPRDDRFPRVRIQQQRDQAQSSPGHTPGNVDEMSSLHALAPRLAEVVSECASGRLTPGPPIQLEIAAARNWARALVLWNIALDPRGGPVEPPNFGCEGCTGLVEVNERTRQYRLGRDYYQLGQAPLRPPGRCPDRLEYVRYRPEYVPEKAGRLHNSRPS